MNIQVNNGHMWIILNLIKLKKFKAYQAKQVDDEIHFLMQCNLFELDKKVNLWVSEAEKYITNFNTLSETEQFTSIMRSKNHTIINAFAKYTYAGFDQAGLVESVTGEAAIVTQVQFSAITGNIFESSAYTSAVRRTDNISFFFNFKHLK